MVKYRLASGHFIYPRKQQLVGSRASRQAHKTRMRVQREKLGTNTGNGGARERKTERERERVRSRGGGGNRKSDGHA